MSGIGRYTYVTDKGSRFELLMDDDGVLDTVRGTPATGALTENLTIKLSKNSKQAGISPRYILFARDIGIENPLTIGLKDTGKKYRLVPCLTKTAWDEVVTDASNANRTTFTQNLAVYKAVRKVAEKIK